MDMANKSLCSMRLLMAGALFCFMGFYFALFAVLGADSTNEEGLLFLLIEFCFGFIVLMLLFPPRILLHRNIRVAFFVAINLCVALLPIAVYFCFSAFKVKGFSGQMDNTASTWYAVIMSLPTLFTMMYLMVNRNAATIKGN